jgi:hypothetical protein
MVLKLYRRLLFPRRYCTVRLLQRCSKTGENCSGGVLFPQRCTFSERKPVFFHRISCDEMALQNTLPFGEI